MKPHDTRPADPLAEARDFHAEAGPRLRIVWGFPCQLVRHSEGVPSEAECRTVRAISVNWCDAVRRGLEHCSARCGIRVLLAFRRDPTELLGLLNDLAKKLLPGGPQHAASLFIRRAPFEILLPKSSWDSVDFAHEDWLQSQLEARLTSPDIKPLIDSITQTIGSFRRGISAARCWTMKRDGNTVRFCPQWYEMFGERPANVAAVPPKLAATIQEGTVPPPGHPAGTSPTGWG